MFLANPLFVYSDLCRTGCLNPRFVLILPRVGCFLPLLAFAYPLTLSLFKSIKRKKKVPEKGVKKGRAHPRVEVVGHFLSHGLRPHPRPIPWKTVVASRLFNKCFYAPQRSSTDPRVVMPPPSFFFTSKGTYI